MAKAKQKQPQNKAVDRVNVTGDTSATGLQVRERLGPLSGKEPPLALQRAWYDIAKDRDWSTVALVPAEEDMSTLELAKTFGQMAAQEPGAKVLVVNGSIQNCRAKTDGGPEPMDEVWASVAQGAAPRALPYDLVDFSRLDINQAGRALDYASGLLEYMAAQGRVYTSAIFSVDPILTQTRAIPVARSADKVCICIRLGQTTIKQIQRIVEIVGRERVIGTVAVRPKSK